MFFAAWFALLVSQPLLVGARRVDLLRRLGLIVAGLAVVMLVLGIFGALIAVANRFYRRYAAAASVSRGPPDLSTIVLAQNQNPSYPIGNPEIFPKRVLMSGYQSEAPAERQLGGAIIKSLPLLLVVLWVLFLVDAATPKIAGIVARVTDDVMATLNQSYGGEQWQR